MIGAHLGGGDHSYKKINKTPAKCLACGEYSECQITHYIESVYIFFIRIKVLDEQFWFDWEQCNHRVVLYDKQDVERYKQEQVAAGSWAVPYYKDMKLGIASLPPKVPAIKIVLVLALCLVLGILLVILLGKLDLPIIFF